MLNHRHILYILLEYGHIVSLMLGLLSKHLIYSLHEFCLGRIIYPKIRENKTHSDRLNTVFHAPFLSCFLFQVIIIHSPL